MTLITQPVRRVGFRSFDRGSLDRPQGGRGVHRALSNRVASTGRRPRDRPGASAPQPASGSSVSAGPRVNSEWMQRTPHAPARQPFAPCGRRRRPRPGGTTSAGFVARPFETPSMDLSPLLTSRTAPTRYRGGGNPVAPIVDPTYSHAATAKMGPPRSDALILGDDFVAERLQPVS